MIKVIYLSHFFISSLYRAKLSALSRNGSVALVALTTPSWPEEGRIDLYEEARHDYEVIPLPSYLLGNGSLFFFSYPKLVRILREFAPDIIHIDEEPWSLSVLETLVARRHVSPRAKFVFDTSQNLFKTYPYPFRLIERSAWRQASLATAISSEAKEVLVRKGCTAPIQVLGHGVDAAIFKALDKAGLRRSLGLPEGFLVGFVGILQERKGVLDLLAAFSRANLGDASLVLVGAGPLAGKIKEEMRQSTALRTRVILTGPVPHREIVNYLNSLDVLVLPSRTTHAWKEQFGRILIEAMACQVPVVGSDSGGIPEVLEEAGVIFPEGEIDELARIIRELQAEPQKRLDLGARGRQRVLQYYTWEKIAARLVELYQGIL